MKIIAIMPIKLKNERCPGKNIRLLGNKPLLQYELDSLKKTKLVDDIYVYCSNDDITDYLPDGIKYLKRPAYLDSSETNFSQIFTEFSNTVDADIYVYAHATAPFISEETMVECIQAVKSGDYDSAFCAEELQDYLWQNGKALNFDATNIPRTQDLDVIYKETSGVYVFRKEVFDKYHRRIGIKPYIRSVFGMESVDIDTEEDFKLAETFLKNK